MRIVKNYIFQSKYRSIVTILNGKKSRVISLNLVISLENFFFTQALYLDYIFVLIRTVRQKLFPAEET